MISGDYVNIIMGSGEWELYHRKEFTKMLVAKGEEITFVNLPVSFTVNLFVKFLKRFIPYFLGRFRVNRGVGFNIYTPLMLFHYLIWRRSRFIGKIDGWFLSFQINLFLKKYYPNRKVRLWVYMPEQLYLVKKVHYDLLVYDSYDDCDLNYDGTLNHKRALLNEKLIKASDFVIVISQYTFDKYSKIAKNIIKSRGGYTLGLFDKVMSASGKLKLDMPVLGYVGTFREWIDYSIIDKLLDTQKYKLMFVGYIGRPSRKYFEKIISNKNVIHIDHIDISEIPKYMKSFSAGLIPFKVNDFMKSVYPNKFFEYIAAEIPVITTALPELAVFKEYIGYSNSVDEFIENCGKSIEGFYMDKLAHYREIKKNNDWGSIVQEIIFELRKLN